MPICPNRSASVASMTQYTYLPRLFAAAGATSAAARCDNRSRRRSSPRASRGDAGSIAVTVFPLRRAEDLLAAPLFRRDTDSFRGGPPRVEEDFRALAVGFGILSAPAALLVRRARWGI